MLLNVFIYLSQSSQQSVEDDGSVLGKRSKGVKRPAGKQKKPPVTVLDSENDSDCVISLGSSSDDDFVMPTTKRTKSSKLK